MEIYQIRLIWDITNRYTRSLSICCPLGSSLCSSSSVSESSLSLTGAQVAPIVVTVFGEKHLVVSMAFVQAKVAIDKALEKTVKEDDKSQLNGPNSNDERQTEVNFGTFPTHIMNLLYWKDPFYSASVLGTCMMIWFLLVITNRTALSLISYGTVFTLVVCFVYINLLYIYTQYIAKASIPKEFKMPAPSFDCMDDTQAQYIVHNLRLFINSIHYYISYITTCKSNKQTLYVLFIAIVTSYFGEWLSGLTLIMLIIICLFTIPYFYTTNFELIQSYSSPIIGILYALVIKMKKLVLSANDNTVKIQKKKQ